MKFKYALLLFGPTSVISFNAGLWQIYRREWKKRIIAMQDNSKGEPITSLPEPSAPAPSLYQAVKLTGCFNYELTTLVGPRSIPENSDTQQRTNPANSGSKWWGEQKGGFFAVAPFRCVDGNIIMVNLGWVPIDAFKGEVYLSKYLRQNTDKVTTLQGMVKYEETRYGWLSRSHPEIHTKKMYKAWALFRPLEMAKETGKVEEGQQRRYYVEMVDEDDTARVVVQGEIFPKRRSGQKHSPFYVTPNGHLLYAGFWFTVCGLSIAALRRSHTHARRMIALRHKEAEIDRQIAAAKAARELEAVAALEQPKI